MNWQKIKALPGKIFFRHKNGLIYFKRFCFGYYYIIKYVENNTHY